MLAVQGARHCGPSGTIRSFSNRTPSTATDRQRPHLHSKQPNAFGLYDMHGNVNEWCLDWHSRDFYSKPAAGFDPICANKMEDPASGRVVRGGSWNLAAGWSRSSVRAYYFPATPAQAKGFRVAIVGPTLKDIPAAPVKESE